jgi:hypothetical protein
MRPPWGEVGRGPAWSAGPGACRAPAPASAIVAIEGPVASIVLDGVGIDIPLPLADPNSGSFRGAGSVVQCDGGLSEGDACGAGETTGAVIGYQIDGSIFPFISMMLSFSDFGAPSALVASVSSFIPGVPGFADTEIEGAATVPQSATPMIVATALPGGAFVEGFVSGPGGMASAADVGDGAVMQSAMGPVTEMWGPFAGVFDCAAIGGCDMMRLDVGLSGLGGGETYQIEGRFDLDAAIVPLPASLPLLLGGIGVLAATRRRRRS